jgi:hypothetical protein
VSSNNCNSLLATGQPCTIGVTFTPTTAGSRLGTLIINGNGNNFPFTVALSGSGNGTGSAPGGSTTQADFSLSGPTSQQVTAGTPSTFSVSLAGLGGSSGQSISFNCTGTGKITCSVSPNPITLGSGANQTATVTVTVPKGQQVVIGSLRRPGRLLAAMLPFGALGLVFAGRRRRWLALLLLLLCLGVVMIGCGGGSSSAPQTPQITIYATSPGGLTHSMTVSLIVS